MAESSAQTTDQKNKQQKKYLHIYNRGASDGIIFIDSKDYETFIDYLNQYLSPPPSVEEQQETFVIRGKEYKGKPHTRKNYHGVLELLAYDLSPNHFHLIFRQGSDDDHQNFMRSFGTRYSMYFNKRHVRTGSVFAGPYKSVEVKDSRKLPHLTRYLHQHVGSRTTYENYIGIKDTSWVKSEIVLEILAESSGGVFRGCDGYRDFVESYASESKEDSLLKKLIIEKQDSDEMGSVSEVDPKSEKDKKEKETIPMETITIIPETVEYATRMPILSRLRLPEFVTMSLIFAILLVLGLRNVRASIQGSHIISPLSQESALTEDTHADQKGLVKSSHSEIGNHFFEVRVAEDVEEVSIRKTPALEAEVISKILVGDSFEFLSMEDEWCAIRMSDGSVGYVLAEFVVISGGHR